MMITRGDYTELFSMMVDTDCTLSRMDTKCAFKSYAIHPTNNYRVPSLQIGIVRGYRLDFERNNSVILIVEMMVETQECECIMIDVVSDDIVRFLDDE